MRVAVTGASGFLGWHVRCRAFAMGVESVPVSRRALADPARLARQLRELDAVVHCAGVNRGTEAELVDGNLGAAQALAEAIRRYGLLVRVVYANSVHSRSDRAYGTTKRKVAELLGRVVPGRFSDVVLPNLFGEHGRPCYQSFVATFCGAVADGRQPDQIHDREIELLHVQDAAELLVGEAAATGDRTVEPAGEPVTVSAVLRLLQEFDTVYRVGDLPDLGSRFRTQLFHTYRSHLFPGRFPIPLPRRSDARGSLVECVRTATTGGQAFVSTTLPGAVRGEHVHLRKFERHVVVEGRAEIVLRRLFTDRMVRFRVSGERPAIVDMPTLWAHQLISLDDQPVTTFFWTNELYRAEDTDTYPCPVVPQ